MHAARCSIILTSGRLTRVKALPMLSSGTPEICYYSYSQTTCVTGCLALIAIAFAKVS